MPEAFKETYLGGGLYASFDGWYIRLRAPREGGDHWVRLEPPVVKSFVEFARQVGVLGKRPDEAAQTPVMDQASHIWADAIRETGIWMSPYAEQVAELGRLIIPRMRGAIESEREARHKCEAAMCQKDAAMGVLFERLNRAGVDFSDLIS